MSQPAVAPALPREARGAAPCGLGLCCPECSSELFQAASSLGCVGCGRLYSQLGGVWCLLSDPGLWRTVWRSRFEDYREFVQRRLAGIGAQLEHGGLLQRTEQRLRRLSAGLEAQLGALSEHFALLDGPARAPSVLPAEARPGSLPALKCYENLFRDWSWGQAESQKSLELVKKLAPSALGRVAVYGAGAGRLAVDVHTELEAEQTFALDINPFPLLVAARLVQGGELSLPEFPIGPASDASVVVQQTLRCASKPGPHFPLVFADALRPPFAGGSIDTALTSWVIDALDADFRDTAAAISRVLRPGGAWLNVGPLRFDGPLSEAYGIEEVHEIVQASGFEIVDAFSERIDYFQSPHSGSSRREEVFCFSARKVGQAPAEPQQSRRADWLLDPRQPIPLTRALQALRRSSVFSVGVLSLVDGQRSLQDLAQALGARWQVPSDTLVDSLRAYFGQIPLE